MNVQVRALGLGVLIVAGALLAPSFTVAQTVGANVNMVSGTQWPGGDPFLQRQNEPSVAVSSRNPFHLLAGANDYRSVDLALTTNGETGDAWLGLFKSLDGGATWRSTLLPGCPYNTPICSGAAGVRNAGFQAAADPTVRAGTNGMFYYAGLVFNRGINPASGIIVSRLIDLNNKENADPNDILNGDAIQYVSTSIVATGTATQFLDKPTMAVDIPRTGAATCNLTVNQPGNGQVPQSFPGGNVYVAYTAFTEAPNTDPETATTPQPSQIFVVRSRDCGATWSTPLAINGPGVINQGTVIAINPVNGWVYVAWREFHYQNGTINQPDAIVVSISTNGGTTFTTPLRVSTFSPFDEGTTSTSFRTNAYPTMAIDGTGRVYIAYSARNAVPSGDARIVLTNSPGGIGWTTPMLVDNPPVDPLSNPSGRGHQIMPALTFAAGRLSLLYYDLRLDHTFGVFSPLMPQGVPTGLYGETLQFAGELASSTPSISAVFNQFVDDSTIALRRHTFDLRVAQALPGNPPVFAPSVLVSQYAYGCCATNQVDIEQLQFNAPNLPIFRSGTAPFMGDYVDIAPSPSFLPPSAIENPDTDVGDADADDWKFNLSASTPPLFHAAWTDNRDVQAPPDGIWTHYTPPNSPSVGATSIFQPGTSVPACQAGFTGSRNQNIYTAPISGGLIFGAPGNTKQLGTTVFNGQTVPFQRSFALVAQNTTNLIKSFRLTIANQPVGGNASFLQFAQLTTLDLSIPPLSSASRPVFVTSTNPTASVTVNIAEITAPAGTLVPNGLTSFAILNPDPTNPAITNPAITNPAITNPAITNFEVTNPAITNPAITNPAITNPAITNPAITNPAITNSTFQSVSVVNPAITNPAITNPAITNASIANPAITNPAITNVNPANTSISDTQWTVTNTGNTDGSFAINLVTGSTVPINNVLQLIISKLYQTPAAPTGQDCDLKIETHNVVVTNIVNPALLQPANPAITNPAITNPAITNATVALAPGESANVIIRVVNTDTTKPTFNPAAAVAPVVVSQSVPTQTALSAGGGGTPPPPPVTVPPLQITTTTLPDAVSGTVYAASVQTTGGNPTSHTFSVLSGALPTGLALDPASGAIAGRVTATGGTTFSFQVQVQDVGSPLFPQHTTTQNLVIRVGSALVFAPVTLPQAVLGTTYNQTVTVTGGIGTIVQSLVGGNLPPGFTFNGVSGLISGIPTATGPFSFTLQAADSASPPQIASQSYTINVVSTAQVPANVAFVTQPGNSVGGQILNGSPVIVQVTDNTGAAIAGANVAMSFNGTPPCAVATLGGTLTQATNAQGQASFPDLSIDRGQLGYTLLAIATNATAVSNPFTVNGFCATKGPISTPREAHSAVTLQDGTVLVAGGGSRLAGVSSPGLPFNSAELYNPSTGTFSATGNMNVPRWGHTATVLLDGRVLIAGGVNSASTAAGTVTNTAEIYDPATHVFTPTPGAMSNARYLHTATLLADGRVLLAGGGAAVPAACILCFGASVNGTADIFDPATGLFTPTSTPMTSARETFTATLLPNGKVLLAGGLGNNGGLSSAELYDPVTNGFSATGGMTVSRVLQTALLLPNGKVLVAAPGLATELYDPAAGTFAATGSLVTSFTTLGGFSAVALADGTALLPGGKGPGPTDFTNSAQIYTPTNGTFSSTGSLVTPEVLDGLAVLHDGTVLATGGENTGGTNADAEVYYSTAPLAPIAITATALAGASTGQPYTQILLQQGGVGTLTWTAAGSLPAGMSFSNQGVLSGTPTVAGTFPLTITLTDSSTPAKTTSSNFTLTVANTPLVFTSNTVPTAAVGRPYSQTLPVVGGTQPYNGTVTSGTLPPGMTVVGNTLTGTPAGSGNFIFTVSVTDSSSPTQTATQTLTMAVNTLVITTTVLPSGIVGVGYSAGINTAGGTLPLSFSLANTAFPPGLSIQPPAPGSSSGALVGKPTQAGTFTFTESVADSSNPQQTATQNYVVTIALAGTAAPANVVFVNSPQNSVGGQMLSGGPVVVQVTDATKTPIPGTTVTMGFTGLFGAQLPCPVATLSGTLTAITDGSGLATFSNLSVDRGAFSYTLLASTGSASGSSGPFAVQGFCATGNLSTQREGNTQDLLVTPKTTVKFPLSPKAAYIFTNSNPGPGGIPDTPDPPLVIPLAPFGAQPGDVITGVPVGDINVCGLGQFCFGEFFRPFVCAVFSTSSTVLPTGGMTDRVPGAITPDFTTAFPCPTGNTAFGNLPTDISQDFALSGERVTVPTGAAFLIVGVADIFYGDNTDPNGDFGVEFIGNSATSVRGKVLIAGGVDNLGNALNTAELYDPAFGTTQPTANLTDPNGRANHVSVVLPNGQVLLVGGDSNAVLGLATAELYDPKTGTFAPTGSMSQGRSLPTAVLLGDGRVLVSGGVGGRNGVLDTAEIYDPNTGLFTPTGNMGQMRTRHTMTLLPNGKVLVTGGRDAQVNFFALANAEIFDPFANGGAGAFTPIANMNSPRFKHTATLLSNGTVLIAGGFNGGNASSSVASAEIFDPNTNAFTPTGTMNTPRARHSATLLPDGTVLMAGGINSFNGVIAASPAELYSPTTGTFSLTGSMITGREIPTATLLLPDGNVLASGGDNGIDVLASTEVYFNTIPQGPIVITTTSVPNGVISQPYVQLLLEQNRTGAIIWSLASGTLPTGITLSPSGILSGTPTAAGSFTFTVQVTDGMSTASATFTISVSLNPLVFTSNTMPSASAGRPYSQPLPITGGTQPYNATVTSGTLPLGLALSSAGILSGTPSSAGSFTFTVSVTDASTPAQTATQTLTMAVDALFITTTALPNGMVGAPYNVAISTSGGTLPLAFSPATSAFPPGLTIQQPAANSHTGALAGRPTLAGHYTFTESVVDSSNPAQTASQYYTMDISPALTTAVPATVTFLSPPQNSIGGQILGGTPVRVHVADANNAPIPGVSVAMSFNGAPPCSSAVLGGTLNVATNGNGNAVFFDLSIDRGQLGYTLLATTGNVAAVSQPFTVNGFCPTGNLSIPRRFPTATLLPNGRVLVAGGDPDTVTSGSASSELFDPTAGSFTPSGPMSSARAGHKATLLNNGQVLVTGGRGPNNGMTTAELYDPPSGVFSPTGSMATARLEHTSTLLADGRILIAGGFSGLLGSTAIYSNGTELYDPSTGKFTATGNLNAGRAFHTATLLPNGKVLIAGGSDSTGALASAEIYDPVTGTATTAGNMSTPRNLHTATLLPNGKVLLAGGQTSTTSLASADLFDPAAGTFTPTGNLLSASVDSRAVLLPDGRVLIASGFTFPAAIAEIYDPATGSFSQTGDLVQGHRGNGATLLANGQVLVSGGQVPGPQTNPILSFAEIYYSTAPLALLQITTPSTTAAGQPGTTVYTTQAAFAAAASGTTTTGFNGIIPAGQTFAAFNPLVVSGITFSTPLSTQGVNVNVTRSTFYTPNYPADIIVNSVVPATGQSAANNTVVITLPRPTNAFAMDFGGLGFKGASSGTITLSNGFVLSLSSLPTVGHTEFRGFVSSTPFTTITYSTANDDFVVQDVMLASANTVLPAATQSQPYTQILLEQGGVGTLTWTQTGGSLPSGLTLTTDGILRGTPIAAGTFVFTTQLTDSSTPAKITSATFTLTVNFAPLVFAPQALPTAVVGQAYGAAIALTGGAAPFSFTVTSGTPPAGITMTSTGAFNGSPTAAGSSTFTVTVKDSSTPQQTVSQSLTIQVANPLAITTSVLPSGTANVAYSTSITSSGGITPVSFAVTSGTSPPGLALASSGPQSATLSGTPTASGTFTFTVTATDTSTPAQTASQPYTVTIAPSAVNQAPVVTTNVVGIPSVPILPASMAVTEYPIVSANSLQGMAVGPDSNLWVADNTGNQIWKITTSGVSTAFPVLSGGRPTGIAAGPDGNMWFTEFLGNRIGRITTSGSITEFTIPTSGSIEPFGITSGPDGNLWFTEVVANQIGRITTAGVITEFAIPTSSGSPEGITTGPDGNLWFVEAGANKIGRITLNGVITEFSITTPNSNPVGIAVGADGNLWFTEAVGNQIGRITTTGTIAEFSIPTTSSQPEFITAAQDGDLWFVESAGNKVSRITTGGLITEFAIPTANSDPTIGIVAGPDGNVWFTEQGASKVGKINPLTSVAVATLAGSVTDDGLPGGNLTTTWSTVSGPGPVTFGSPSLSFPDVAGQLMAVSTQATFTTPGNYALRLTVSDSQLSSTANVNVTVNSTLVLAAQSLNTGLVGTAYSGALVASGGTPAYNFVVTSGVLPAGITLAGNGQFSGAPTTPGTSVFTVQVTDSSALPQTASQNFSIQVVAPLAITTTSLPNGTVGTFYNQAVVSSGGLPPAGFAVTSGTLPTGLTLASNGGITGTPTVANTFTFTITATDGSTPAQTASQSYTVTITAAVVQPAQVTFLTQPQNSTGGQNLIGAPLQVLVTDPSSTPISGATVTLGFNGTPVCANATINGSSTLTAITDATGTATFGSTPPGVVIDRGHTNYSLAATAGTITAVSNPFNVEGFCSTGTPTASHLAATATLLPNGKVLLIGGIEAGSTTTVTAVAELYDPSTGIFTPTGSMNTPRSSHTATLLNDGTVLVTGGNATSGPGPTFVGGPAMSSAEIYDPATGVFTALSAAMTSVRSAHAAALLDDGTVLIAGGYDNTSSKLNTAELYNPTTQTFTPLPNMTDRRQSFTATLLPNGKVLLAGGFGSQGVSRLTAELYDPVAQTFSATPPMVFAHAQHTATLLTDGRVAIIGGVDSNNNIQTGIEFFNPNNTTFAASATAVNPALKFQSATLLTDGRVLVDGGADATPTAVNSAETFNFVADTSAPTGSLQFIRAGATATLLPDGTVLAAGGAFTTGFQTLPPQPAEIFYPASFVPIAITTVLPTALLNVPYTQQLQQLGGVGTLTWSVSTGTLPTGLTLSTSGLLSGTPTVTGVSQFTVQVTDSSTPPRTTSTNYIVAVVPPVVIAPTLPTANPGVFYSQSLVAFGAAPPLTFALTGGALPTGFNLASDGTVSGTTTATGTFTFTVTATDSSTPPVTATQVVSFTVAPPLAITTTTLPGGQVGVAYSASILTTGGAGTVVFGLNTGALPSGLNLSPQGVLSGTPTVATSFTFSIAAVDSSVQPQVAQQSYTVNITPGANGIALTPNPLNLIATNSGSMTVTLGTAAPTNGLVVTLTSSNTGVATVPGSVTVPQGSTTMSFPVTSGTVAGSSTITASATGLISGTATVNLTLRTMTVITPGALLGVGRGFSATVTLDGPAPAGGTVVTLASSDTTVATVSPVTFTIAPGATTATFALNGLAPGVVILTASAAGFQNAVASLTITGSLISLQSGLVVAPSQSGSLAVSLSSPAPTGGVTINFVSSDTTVAMVTPSVVVPQGQQTPAANPQVTGVGIGAANITATATGFAPDIRVVQVTVTAALDSFFIVPATRTGNINLTISAPAPQPNGLTFSPLIDNTSIATVPPTATIPAGQLSVAIPVSGIAPGTANLSAAFPGIATATTVINVGAAPVLSINVTNILGQNLQVDNQSLGLGASAPSNENLTLTSDSANVLLSSTPTGPFSQSITLPLSQGSFSISTFSVQGLANSGSATLTASAAGYANGTATVNLTPSGFEWFSANFNTTTFSTDTPLTLVVGPLDPVTLNFQGVQNLRTGLTVSIPVTSSDTTVGTIVTSPVVFTDDSNFIPTAFHPLAPGPATLSFSNPAGFSTPNGANATSITATVFLPVIGVQAPGALGQNLQVDNQSVSLQAAPPSNETLTLTSDSANVLLADNPAGPFSQSITLPLSQGSTSVPGFSVQGLANSGSAQLTASASGYANGTATVNLTPSGFGWFSSDFSTSSFSADTSLTVVAAQLDPTSLAAQTFQNVRTGLTVNVTVTSSDTTVGTIVVSPVVFSTDTNFLSTTFHPVGPGTANLVIAAPTGFATPVGTGATSIAANVSAPALGINVFTNLGQDLQVDSQSISLGAAPPSNRTLTLTSNSASVLLANTPAGPFSQSINLPLSQGSFSVPAFSMQGLANTGTAQLTATATGYSNGTATVNLTPSGFEWLSSNFNTTTFSPDSNVTLAAAQLNATTLAVQTFQNVRTGLTVNVTVTSSSPTVGTIVTSPLVFTGDANFLTTTFHALTAGSTNLVITTPAGFATPSGTGSTSITAAVSAPAIGMNVTSNLGQNLQVDNQSVSLGAAPPNNETLTLSTSSSNILLANSPAGPFSQSITLSLFKGSSTVPSFSMQGLASSGSAQVTAQAPGYSDGVIVVNLTPSGIVWSSGNFNTTTFSSDTTETLAAAQLNATTLTVQAFQNVRTGLSVGVAVTSSNTAFGTIVSPVVFNPDSNFPSTTFHPVASGTTNLVITTPAGFTTPNGSGATSIAASVSAPTIGISVSTNLGQNLQVDNQSIGLTAAPPTSRTLTLSSSSPNVLLANTPAGPFLQSISLALTQASFSVPAFSMQGLASSGSVLLTATASGYTDGTVTVSLVPSGIVWNSSSFNTTTFSPDTSLSLVAGPLNPTTLTLQSVENIRTGLTVNVAVTSSNTAFGTIVSPVVFSPDSNFPSTTFHPVASGTTNLVITTPAGFTTPNGSGATSIAANVSAPTIGINVSTNLGQNLQVDNQSISLAAAPPTSRTLTLSSSSPNVLLANTPAGPFSQSISLALTQASFSVPTFSLQGLASSGSVLLTATASGYTDGTVTVSLVPSGIVWNSSSFNTTTFSPDTSLSLVAGPLNPTTLTLQSVENIRTGLTVNVAVTSSNTAFGTIVSPVVFSPDSNFPSTTFHPVASGTTNLVITTPAGFTTPNGSGATSIAATVSAPTISINVSTNLGQNLQVDNQSIGLAAAPPSNETLTLTSNSSAVLLAASPTGPFSQSITLPLTQNSFSVPLFSMQGLTNAGTVQLTASALGYTSGVSSITLTPSGIVWNGGDFTTTTTSGDTSLAFSAVQLNPSTLTAQSLQNIRTGMSVSVTLSSSVPGVGTIASPVIISPDSNFPSTTFHPVAPGATSLVITTPAGFTTPNPTSATSITATVN